MSAFGGLFNPSAPRFIPTGKDLDSRRSRFDLIFKEICHA